MTCLSTTEASYAIELADCFETCEDPILGPTDALLVAKALRHYAGVLAVDELRASPAATSNNSHEIISAAA